jgi:hypothetical protein
MHVTASPPIQKQYLSHQPVIGTMVRQLFVAALALTIATAEAVDFTYYFGSR